MDGKGTIFLGFREDCTLIVKTGLHTANFTTLVHMKSFRNTLLLTLLVVFSAPVSAQNLKGGDMTFDINNGNTVTFYISIYTKPSLPGSWQYVLLSYGDGITDTLPLPAGNSLPFDTEIHSLTATHIYPGPGSYNVNALTFYRMPFLTNVNNSGTELLQLQASFNLSPLFGPNTSPAFTFNQADITFNLGTFIHDANAIDANGDSVVYTLVHPGTINYTFPNATVNPVTGLFTMPALNQFGAYVVAIRLDEFRFIGNQPVQISTTMRSMTIETPLINSITAAEAENNTTVFPNPFEEYTTLTFPETFTTPVQLIVTDMHGQELSRETVTGNRHLLQRNGRTAGLYLFRIENNGKLISRGKLSVQK